MTVIVDHEGRELDIDPLELNGWELSRIKTVTGLRWRELVVELKALDGDAIRALYWAAELRTRPELKFSDYQGPTMSAFMADLVALSDAMGKLPGVTPTKTEETPGTPASVTTSDSSPDASTTD